MPNLIEVNYEQAGASKSTNEFSAKDIKERIYERK